MATMACYPTFEQQSSNSNRATAGVVSNNNNNNTSNNQQQKDYSKPLHVDCSVEYELPNQARPPGKSEPLLMIHPCFYRRAESQRRSPFINNLPQTVVQQQIQQTRRTSSRNTASNSNNSSTSTSNTSSSSTNNTLLLQQQRYAAQQQQMRYMEQVQQQQAYQQTMVSAAAWNIDQNSASIYCKPPTTRSTRRNSRKTTTAAAAAAVTKELVIARNTSDYTSHSSGDSGISGVLWNDTDRSPAVDQQQKLVYQHQSQQQNGLGNVDTMNLPTHLNTSDKNLIHESSQSSQAAPPAASRRGGYSLRSDSNNSDLAELLAAACGAEHLPPLPKVGAGPGKTQLPSSQPQSSTSHQHHQQQHGAMCQQLGGRCGCLPRSQQQPAVGVAAVACRSCRSQQLPPQITQSYQHQAPQQATSSQQQPWPAQFAHPPAAVPATACEPEPAAAASGQVRRAWSRSGPTPSAKRSRVSQQQQQQQNAVPTQQVTTTFPSSSPWVTTNPFLESNTPVWSQQRQTTSCGLGSNNNNNNNSSTGKDCGGSMCKVCCPNTTTSSSTVLTPHIQQQSFQQQQQQSQDTSQQQWNASYYCRGASEDGGRMLWNNENMLRLFQV